MNIQQSLQKLGLDEAETKVYTHLLSTSAKSNSNTAFDIAAAIKIPRSTVYLTLDRLEEKKLVTRYKKNNVLHFLSESPNRFKLDIKEKTDILESLIPELLKLRNQEEFKSSVRAYSGDEGVKIVFEDIYDNPHHKGITEYHTISNPKLINHFPKSFSKLLDYKRSLHIKTKLITLDEVRVKGHKEYKNDTYREVRFLPSNFTFDGTLVVYGAKAALFSHKENEVYSVIIESTAIVDMLNAIFLCLWDLLPSDR